MWGVFKSECQRSLSNEMQGTGQLERIVCIVWGVLSLNFAESYFHMILEKAKNIEQSKGVLVLIILPEVLEELQKQCLLDGIVCKHVDTYELSLWSIRILDELCFQ